MLKSKLLKRYATTKRRKDLVKCTTYYRSMVRKDKETKIYATFNASCSYNLACLNDCLYTDPSMSRKIFDVFLRF